MPIPDPDELVPASETERLSLLIRALSHEHRLMILLLLGSAERSVSELEAILEVSQPAVSQQLARLRHDGFVNVRRAGRSIFYSLRQARLEELRDLLLWLHEALAPVPPAAAAEAPDDETPAPPAEAAGGDEAPPADDPQAAVSLASTSSDTSKFE